MDYRERNKERISEQKKAYNKIHNKKISNIRKEFRKKNKERVAKQKSDFYQRNKEKIVKHQKKYLKTDSGRISKAKVQSRRRGDLGYNPLNKPFEGCDGHHVDNNRVIFIPSEIHKRYPHRLSNPKTMIEINEVAFEFMYMTGIHNIENIQLY